MNALEKLYLEYKRLRLELMSIQNQMELNLDNMVSGISMDILKARALELFEENEKHRYIFSLQAHHTPHTIKALTRKHYRKNQLNCRVELIRPDLANSDIIRFTVSDNWGEFYDTINIRVSDAGYSKQLAEVKASAKDRKAHEELRIYNDKVAEETRDRETYERLQLKFKE